MNVSCLELVAIAIGIGSCIFFGVWSLDLPGRYIVIEPSSPDISGNFTQHSSGQLQPLLKKSDLSF
jgi:hypothetical protein